MSWQSAVSARPCHECLKTCRISWMNKQGLVIEGEKNQPYLNRAMKQSMGREQQADSFHGIRQMAHSSRVHDSCIFMVNGQRYSPYSEGLPDHIHPRMCWDCPCHLGCTCDATMTGPVEVIIIIVHHAIIREESLERWKIW